MAIVPNNSQLNSSLESMLQGLAFWMGYSKSMNELYEHDCVHQAFTILRANFGKDYSLQYEYLYSDIDKSINSQERADLVVLDKNDNTPLCVMEFKMSDNTNGGVTADVKKLRKITREGVVKLIILLFYEDNNKLRDTYLTGTGNAVVAKRRPVSLKGIEKPVRVKRVAKAMATANRPKRSPYMAVCIEV